MCTFSLLRVPPQAGFWLVALLATIGSAAAKDLEYEVAFRASGTGAAPAYRVCRDSAAWRHARAEIGGIPDVEAEFDVRTAVVIATGAGGADRVDVLRVEDLGFEVVVHVVKTLDRARGGSGESRLLGVHFPRRGAPVRFAVTERTRGSRTAERIHELRVERNRLRARLAARAEGSTGIRGEWVGRGRFEGGSTYLVRVVFERDARSGQHWIVMKRTGWAPLRGRAVVRETEATCAMPLPDCVGVVGVLGGRSGGETETLTAAFRLGAGGATLHGSWQVTPESEDMDGRSGTETLYRHPSPDDGDRLAAVDSELAALAETEPFSLDLDCPGQVEVSRGGTRLFPVTIRLTNITETQRTVRFAGGSPVEIHVRNARGETVYLHSAVSPATRTESPLDLAPGEKRTWLYTPFVSEPGTYLVETYLRGTPTASASTTIQVMAAGD